MTDQSLRATEQELGEIHGSMAQWCILILKGVPLLSDGKVVLKEDGTPHLVPPSPAHLNVVRQFLKDNKIEAPAVPGSKMEELSSLPHFEDDPTVVPIRRSKCN